MPNDEEVVIVENYQPDDPDSPRVIFIANAALSFYTDKENLSSDTEYKLDRIIKAESQVHFGWNYKLTFTASNSEDTIQCDSLVYKDPHNKITVQSVECVSLNDAH